MNSFKGVLFFLIAFSFTPSVFGQKDPIKFGRIEEKDLKMTVYDKDSSASAVILCDYGDTRLDYNTGKSDFEMIYYRHVRIKIFKADADVIENLVNVEIPLQRSSSGGQEAVSTLKAITYQLDNGKLKETKMDKSSIFDKELNKNYSLKKFTLPDVKDGVVVEYVYTIVSDFLYSPHTWFFQAEYPVIHSEYRFSHPEYYSYAFNQEGFHRLVLNERDNSSKTITFITREGSNRGITGNQSSLESSNITMSMNNFRWSMDDVPALKGEPYITKASDYFDKMEFQLNAVKWPNQPIRLLNDTWAKFSKNLLEDDDIGGKLKKRGAIDDLVKTIIQGKTDPKEKVIAVANYIKTNINVKSEGSLISNKSHKKVLEDKVGTIGDVNLLLGGMCIEAGLKVKPVLLSTRSNGRIATNYPLLSRFNYLIMQVQVDTTFMLVDASEPLLPVGVLPYEVLNGQGLLLDEQNPDWVNLQGAKTVDFTSVEATIENGKTLKGKVETTNRSYDALKYRKNIAKDGEEQLAKNMLEKLVGNGSLKSKQFENAKNPYEPLKGKFEFETTEFMEANAEHIYFSPWLSFGYTNNPFKKAERIYPIDFAHPFDKLYNLSFKIPAGYIVEELPKSSKVQFEDGSVLFQYVVVNDEAQGLIKITSKFQVKKPVFAAAEYADLKKTYDTMIAKQAEQIVLKKQSK